MGVHLGSTLAPRLWQGARHNFNWGLPCTSLAHVSRSSQRPAPLLFCPFRLSRRVRFRRWGASSAELPTSFQAFPRRRRCRRRHSPCRYRHPPSRHPHPRPHPRPRPRRGCLRRHLPPRPASPRRICPGCQRPQGVPPRRLGRRLLRALRRPTIRRAARRAARGPRRMRRPQTGRARPPRVDRAGRATEDRRPIVPRAVRLMARRPRARRPRTRTQRLQAPLFRVTRPISPITRARRPPRSPVCSSHTSPRWGSWRLPEAWLFAARRVAELDSQAWRPGTFLR
jgi:hypothetical protein